MATNLHYKSNLRDIEFNLFEVLDIGATSLGRGPFASMNADGAREALAALDAQCREEIAASFVDADRNPPTMDESGDVHLPQSLRASIDAYMNAGWHRLGLPEHIGGFGAPPTVEWAAHELLLGANATVAFYIAGAFVARVIDTLATDAQKRRYLPRILERNWSGAMVLTEPDAGSDVGAARTRARHVRGDEWHIEGTKRFITNGDSDCAENLVHLVLARPDGAGPGTKGLSMFIVPKFWVEEDGSMGARNGLRCSTLEKKMGIKSSATCEMEYGLGDTPCRGLLVGDVHDGIRQMFQLIEQARMLVGVKSMATLSTAYLNALQYAKERVQGPDLLRAADKTAPRVRIIEHPDVRRMLMAQKAHAEGLRALALFTASIQDQVALLGGHKDPNARALDRLNDLLLPLVKGYSSEKVYEMLSLSLQTFGGSGYVQDFPIEQYVRDQKIDSLYEGTTHIQALDLLLRKVARDGGETLRGLLGRVREIAEGTQGGDALAAERKALAAALGEMEATFYALMGKLTDSLYHVGLQGNRVLFALAELVIGSLLVRHASVASAKLGAANAADRAFYEGKIASARWWCANVLPGLALTRKFVEESTLDLMSLREEAF
jgi:hypothetical protein